ncbi:MAG: methyltransferase domain-containing protein [Alphaproteobacteria bacterium]|nr:methyltransferase domain-containing protein [Alphaproteobacteria bacterium]
MSQPSTAEKTRPPGQDFCTAIENCRLCGSGGLTDVFDLGTQALTGVFPKSAAENIPAGPMRLVQCDDCNLVQLAHNYQPGMLYGQTYGYRSGLNASMVRHLEGKVAAVCARVALQPGDWVIDIGSNDGTTLGAYKVEGLRRLGIDPSAAKFRKFYQPGIEVVEDFFSADAARKIVGAGGKARVITSIAMFYDLQDPCAFAREVAEMLADDGVWVFEQSYLPAMLAARSYDTVCQEHLEYYALAQIKFMADKIGLKIVDVALNDINGGSFSVTAAKQAAPWPEATAMIHAMMAEEKRLGLDTPAPLQAFQQVARAQREELLKLLQRLQSEGKKVLGYGASTKGNVLLQYCGINSETLPCIAEVNPDKFGAFTPGTKIPIVAETEAHAMQPDYFLVLPWHFRDAIVAREQAFLARGGKLIFPMPELEIVGRTGA